MITHTKHHRPNYFTFQRQYGNTRESRCQVSVWLLQGNCIWKDYALKGKATRPLVIN
jgi:hypothetical protein